MAITGVGGASEMGCTGVCVCVGCAGLVGVPDPNDWLGAGFTAASSGASIPLLQPRTKIAAPTPTPPLTRRMLMFHVYRVKHQRSSSSQPDRQEDLGPLEEIAQPVLQIAPPRDPKSLTPDP
jgi:hypothetical protein